MVHPSTSAPLRVGLALSLMVSVASTTSGVLAEEKKAEEPKAEQAAEPVAEPAGGATVVIHGGNFSTENNVTIGADGVTTTADSSGGSTNSAETGGVSTADGSGGTETAGSIETASAGNGGVTTADGSGGEFYSPTDADGNPIPAVETGGNQGSNIQVGDTTGGTGSTSIEIYGGDMSVRSDLEFSVDGGAANASAPGGDGNLATLVGASIEVDGQIASAGNGGVANASATGGSAPLGTVLTGRNEGAKIFLGDTVGGVGNGGDVDVKIHGGTMDITTIASLDVATGGTADALAPGGMMNVAEILGDGAIVAAGNGGVADASANGGVTTIGAVDGELFAYPISGLNRGANITLLGVQSGSGYEGGVGGDATVDIYGGDLTAYANGVDGPADAGRNSGANIDAGQVVGGDAYGGTGGDATLILDGGSIDAYAAGPTGADAAENRGADIDIQNVIGGQGLGGDGGDATVDVEASDISASGTGLEIVGPTTSDLAVDLPYDGPGASAGDGGEAVASANSGSASTGPVLAGDNVGTDIRIGTVAGGDGIGGVGGDATVQITGTDISTSFEAGVNVSGGAAGASALGGLDNVAGAPEDDGTLLRRGSGSAAAGSGGFAGANANGGEILIGTILVGANNGGVISVGNVTGGDGVYGEGGDATFSLDGGSIEAAVLLDLEAIGGTANASADGGGGNLSLLLGDGTTDLGAYAGTGGVALAGANGGLISIGDVVVGQNVGASAEVGDVTGGDGLYGGVGGDATLAVEGSSIVSIIALALQANGGIADASADGGDDNVAVFDARDASRKLTGIDVLAGVGGVANAFANGGAILIGDLIAGQNVGTVVDFGNIRGGDGANGGRGDSMVYNKFGGDVITVTTLAAAANGGVAGAGADGGDGNVAYLRADGTILNGVPRVGNGGTVVSAANGGVITAGDIVSGQNEGASFEQPRRDRQSAQGQSAKPVPAKPVAPKPSKPGKPGGVKEIGPADASGGKAAKGGKNVDKLPSTGHGPATAGVGGGVLPAAAAAVAVLGGWLRRRGK